MVATIVASTRIAPTPTRRARIYLPFVDTGRFDPVLADRASPIRGDAVTATVPGNLLTFVGHSTVLVELGGVRLLTDPVLRDRLLHLRRHATAPARGVAERIDAVLISHLHGDHLDLPSLRSVGADVPLIVPRGAAAWLNRAGFERVVELAAGETTEVGQIEVAAVEAHHQPRRWTLAGPK